MKAESTRFAAGLDVGHVRNKIDDSKVLGLRN